MMRLSACVLGLLFAVIPTVTLALGLGNVEVSTTLNEPLRAEIPVTGIKPGEVELIDVRLGTNEQFRRAGIERPFHLTQLKFKVVSDGERKARIEVTTRESVTEPFLNFLVELNWPSGRMIREYTLLLDPPVYGAAISSMRKRSIATVETVPESSQATAPQPLSEPLTAPEAQRSPPAPVTAPRAAAPGVAAPGAPEPSPEPYLAPKRAAAPTAAMAPPPDLAGVDRYGPVVANESLWSIAARVRPDEGISIQRMMLAMLEANRNAFFLDNINALKKGAVLRVPGRDEIGPDEKALAMAEVRRYQATWDDYRRQLAGVPSATPEGVQASAPGAAQATGPAQTTGPAQATGPAVAGGEETARLELLASGASPSAGAPGNQMNLAQLQQELNMTLEEADSRQRENKELSERLSETERIISDLNRMLELKDDEIANLQNQLRQQEAAPAPAPQPALPADTTATTPEPVPEPATPVAPAPAATTAPQPATPAAPAAAASAPQPATPTAPVAAPKPKPKPIARPPQPAPQPTSFVDELLNTARGYAPSGVDPVLMAGGLGILLILGGGLALYRRRQAAEGGVEPEAIDFEDDDSLGAFADGDAIDDKTEPSDDDDRTLLASDEANQPAGSDTGTGGTMESADEDPLSELNIYMAYEHFDQAEDLVRRAITDSPDRHDYRLKLLEVFYAAKNLPSFQDAARELRDIAGADSPLIATAAGWWEDLAPGRDLFGGPQPGASQASGTAVEGEDEVFDVTSGTAGDTEASAVDFDLGFAATGAGEGEMDSQGSGVDFDLDSGESGVVTEAGTDSGSDVEFDLSDLGEEASVESAENDGDDFFAPQKNGGAAAVDINSSALDFDVSDSAEEAAKSADLDDSAFNMDLDLGTAAGTADQFAKPAHDSGLDFEFDSEQSDAGDDNAAGLELEAFQDSDTNTEADGDLTAMDERLDRDTGTEVGLSGQFGASGDDDLGLDFDIGEELDDGKGAPDDVDLAIGLESDDSHESSGLDFSIEGDEEDAPELSAVASGGSSDVDFEIGGDQDSDKKIGIDTVFDGVFDDSATGGANASDVESGEDPLGIGAGSSELPRLDTDTEDAVDLTFLGDAAGTAADDDALADLEFGDENTDDDNGDDANHTEFLLREVPQLDTSDLEFGPGGGSGEGSGDLDDIQTKLDLAEAYIEMGDTDGARGILGEVMDEGTNTQQEQAKDLLEKLG
ncbi:MAG: hypothetical protein OER43_08930 [Gammaproteobacteria bacterium]|nr:hypothetical protein [Gammaproteobacteria bacterium]